MKRVSKQAWNESENKLLLEYYYTLSLNALLAVLPGRSARDIDKQAAFLNRKNRSFNRK